MKILSFDIEDWFHILDNDSTKSIHEWCKYETRIHSSVNRLLNILEQTGNPATFFVLGWIANKYPEVVKLIQNSGYEIASHSNLHQLAYLQSRKQFRNDTSRSIKILEDITGEKIKYFRAPGFSITKENLWTFDILCELGIEIDCSVFPAYRAHGGIPSFKPAMPSIIKHNGIEIKELPINTLRFLGQQIAFSGGGYFRIFPYSFIKKWTIKSKYVMGYFHPRDFDTDQPIIKDLSLIRKFKSYVGLCGAEEKFLKWLSEFDFMNITAANEIIEWENVEKIVL